MIGNKLTLREGVFHVLVELSGPQLFPPEDLDGLKQRLTAAAGRPLKLYVHSRPEVVVTDDGYTTLEALNDSFLKQMDSANRKKLQKIIEEGL